MKLLIDQSSAYEDVEITIKCGVMDARLEKLISLIRLYSFSIIGKKDGRSYTIALHDIYYFETVDERTFVYLKDDFFETELRLYELEKQLTDSRFLRVNKACILNVEQLTSVRAFFNGKYEAQLKNGEKILINRHYVSEFKKKFDI